MVDGARKLPEPSLNDELKDQLERANVITSKRNSFTPEIEAMAHNLRAENDNSIFLPYQRDLIITAELYDLVVCEKSRRIGATWGLAGWAALKVASSREAGGQDVLYIGPSLDMAREFIDVVGEFARAMAVAVTQAEEFVFNDQDEEGNTREIKAFRVTCASGFECVALTSHPRSLRGRQGIVIIDEAAFHDDLDEVLKAALALLMWGGKVIVLSTHNGEENAFNTLIQDIRSGRRVGKNKVIRIDFEQALNDGLYRRICKVKKQPYSIEAEKEWEANIRGSYGSAADEELDAIPSQGSGAVLPLSVLERAQDKDIPVLTFEAPKDFLQVSQSMRNAVVKAWLLEHVQPLFKARLNRALPSYLGQDFGMESDLSFIWINQRKRDMSLTTPFVIELSKVPHEAQREILFYIIENLPNFSGAALDAGGNGSYLAQSAQLKYGSDMVQAVKFSVDWYRENMPRMKAAIEDGDQSLPKDSEIIDDFRALTMIKGVIRIPDKRKGSKRSTSKRHGESAIGCALCHFAATQEPIAYTGGIAVSGELDFSEEQIKATLTDRPDHSSDGASNHHTIWNKGTW